MTKKNSDHDNLEFNDGLGDLLREKESRQFSIQRTLIVLVVFVVVVFLVLLATVKFGTKFLFTSTDKTATVQTQDIDSDALVRELAEMERLMAQKKGSHATSDAVVAEATPTPPVKAIVPPAKTSTPTVNAAPVAPKPVVKEVPKVVAKPVVKDVPKVVLKPVVKEVPKGVSKPVVKEVPKGVSKPVVKDIPKVVSKPVAVSKPAAIKRDLQPKPQGVFPYKVIVGTFSNKTNALSLKDELKKHGVDAFLWERHTDGQDWHAVQAGAFPTQDSAQRFAAELRKKGYPAYVLRQ